MSNLILARALSSSTVNYPVKSCQSPVVLLSNSHKHPRPPRPQVKSVIILLHTDYHCVPQRGDHARAYRIVTKIL